MVPLGIGDQTSEDQAYGVVLENACSKDIREPLHSFVVN